MQSVHKMTDAELAAEADLLEAIDLFDKTDAEERRARAIEREQDARADWNSDDDRIRESVGNYR